MADHQYDLILVGTSFASSFFLKKYLEKSSAKKKVLVLERGNYFTHQERLANAQSKAFGDNSFISSLGGPQHTYISNSDKPWIFDPNFGGSSNCWTGCTPRFMPNDFKLKSLYGVGMDWPISYEDIEPYYVETEEMMAIAGPKNTPYPMSRPYPLPPHQLSTVDKILHDKYGELYISQPTARASKATGNRNACCTSAICHLCPVNAKFTIDNGLRYLYDDERITIIYGAQVVRMITQNDIATGVEYLTDGVKKVSNAEVVAMGANAIYNAHILLNSGDSNLFTGKGLSEQIGYYAYFYLNGLENLGGSSTITANGFMLHDGPHRKTEAGCIIESHNDAFVRGEFGKWRQIAKFKFVFEDIPQEENYVTLSENELIPKVVYKGHSDYVEAGYNSLSRNIHQLFDVLPIERIELDKNYQASESHILGTTRMGSSKQNSVLDKNLIHHQYRNVFVLGGGAFPAISPSNPTLTLAALSLMAANNNF